MNVLFVTSYEGLGQFVRLLVEKGTNVNAQSGEHENALQAASHEAVGRKGR